MTDTVTRDVGHADGRRSAPGAGYAVHDPEGKKIGCVKELFPNAAGEPEYVRVRLGVVGKGTVLIPVAFAAPASTVDRPEVVASSSAPACESSARTSNTREV